MKFGYIRLKSKTMRAIVYTRGSGREIAVMGCALMAEGAFRMAKEEGIPVEVAHQIIIDSFNERKPYKEKISRLYKGRRKRK